MIILTTAVGYGPGELSIFWDSLMGTGYKGKVVVIGDAPCLESRGAKIIPLDIPSLKHINFLRWEAYAEYLKSVDEPVVITDVRDVVFQKNPEEFMPTEGVNVFEEDAIKTIGECWFNNHWMEKIGVNKFKDKNIICAGVTSGRLSEYAQAMWDSILEFNIDMNILENCGGDQAVHNNLIYSGFPAKIHKNEKAEVYTVGHTPSVETDKNDFIINKEGYIPCMVHLYDRHVNLIVSAIKRLKLRVELNREVTV